MSLFKQIDKVHLTDNNHPFLVFVHAVDEVVVITVVDVQSLVARDDTYFGQGIRRKLEQRFGNRDIDMNRSLSVMVHLQQGFIYQAVAVPFIFIRVNLRKIDRLLDQRPKHARLR